ncbi:MAG TPA: CDP-alcohol phosphatidyltransferase family protein [Candidatus Cybelea sp.]|nr:CDP-alcohol phosphatidyltransferase family protein [Candidatus Cybelea sp.]
MKGRIWTVPNQITLLRLGFLPIFLILIAYDRYRWALLVLVFSGLSDGFDGLLARSLNQRSALGAYLDPIADKLLLSSSFLILAFKKQLAWWLTILVLSRDVLILIVAVVILLTYGYRPFPPSIYGKLTTATEIILVFLVVLGAAYSKYHISVLNHIFIYTVTVLSVASGFHYSFTTARHLSSFTPEAK